MKKQFLISMSVIVFFLAIQGCKKDNNTVSNTSVSGTWKGRYSDISFPTEYINGMSATIQKDGNISITDSASTSVFTGTYTISGDSLITTVTLGSGNINFRFNVINSSKKMEGKWANLDGSASGLAFINKQ